MSVGAKLTLISDSMFRRMFKLYFRYDLFISYARQDGKEYAFQLKNQLAKLDFSCFLDYDELPPGNSLNKTLKRAIKRSATLVVVGTKRATQSRYVEMEISEFAETGRAIIPIDMAGTLATLPWSVIRDRDLVWIDETSEALERDIPSPNVADSIDKLFKYTRRNVRVRTQVLTTILLFFMVVAIAFFVSLRQVRAANAASAQAAIDKKAAEKAQVRAQEQERNAVTASAEAERQKIEAKKSKTDAEIASNQARTQERIALANAEKARRQQKIAEERTREGLSRQLAANSTAQLQTDPELSILLALAATHTKNTHEAEGALRQSLLDSHVRTVLRGHNREIKDANFSAHGDLIVTTSGDAITKIWNATSGEQVGGLSGDGTAPAASALDQQLVLATDHNGVQLIRHARTGQVLATSYRGEFGEVISPDGKYVATFGGKARLFEISTGRNLLNQDGLSDDSTGAAFSPDSKRVIIVSCDSAATAWETETGHQLTELKKKHDRCVSHVAFSPDGKLFVTTSDDMMAWVWDATSWEPLAQLQGHTAPVNRAEFSPDNRLVVTSSDDDTASIWEARTGRRLVELRGHRSKVNNAAFSHNGKYVVTASSDGKARIWDVATGGVIKEFYGHENAVARASFSPDDRFVLTAGYDSTARVWDARVEPSLSQFQGHLQERVTSVAFSPDDKKIVTTSWDKTARVWDVSTGKPIAIKDCDGGLDEAVFSSDGKSVLSSCRKGMARIWDAATGKTLHELPSPGEHVISVGFTPRGKYAVTAGLSKPARLWDAANGSLIRELPGKLPLYGSVAFSADGRRVVIGGNEVVDIETGKSVAQMKEKMFATVDTFSFSPDGKSVVTAYSDDRLPYHKIRLWDAYTGRVIAPLKGHQGGIIKAAFSPDSKLVVTTSSGANDNARVWDARTGRLVATLIGHTEMVNDAAFSPDSKLVVTVSMDKTARVWEANTGKALLELGDRKDKLMRVAFSHDGESIAITGEKGLVQMQRCEVCASLDAITALARERARRELSFDEKVKYLPKLTKKK
jgi:WD40 repeat protein